MITSLNKLAIGEMYLNIIEDIYDKWTANIELYAEVLKASPFLKIRKKTRMSFLTPPIHIILQSPSLSK